MRVVVIVLVVGLAAAGFAVAGSPNAPEATAATVQVSNFRFEPASVSIPAGDAVTWQWVSGTHNVQTRDGAETWCGTRSSGTCDKIFTTPGTYDYRCGIHPGSMLGTVTVTGTPPAVTIDTPLPGEQFEASFTSSGSTQHDQGISGVEWRIDTGTYRAVDSFAADGTTATWSTMVDTTGLSAGPHTLEIRARATSGVTGTATLAFHFVSDDLDLRVDSLTGSTGPRSAQLQVTVTNAGAVAVNDAIVRFEYLYHGTWREIGSIELDILAGRTLTRFFTWDSGGKIGSFDVRATIDPDDVFPETDETNNAKSAKAAFVNGAIPGFDPLEPI